MTTTDTPEPNASTKARDMQALDPEQCARVAALRAANGVLAATGFASRQAVDPVDLVNIAEYILTGKDPWEAATSRIVENAAVATTETLADMCGIKPATIHVDSGDA